MISKPSFQLRFLLVSCMVFSTAWGLCQTPEPPAGVLNIAISADATAAQIRVKEAEGHLLHGISLKGLTADHLPFLPPETVVQVQEIGFNFQSQGLKHPQVNILNGKITIPTADPILFYGQYSKGKLNVDVATQSFSLALAQTLFPLVTWLKNYSGSLSAIDLRISGQVPEFLLDGKGTIERLKFKDFDIQNMPVEYKLHVTKMKSHIDVRGTIDVSGGVVNKKKSLIHIIRGKLSLNGDVKNPDVQIEGYSIVERVKINILLTGTRENPDFKLTSDSDYSEKELFIMLATGKRWKSVDSAVASGEVTAEVIKDFMDYFVFPETRGKILRQFGIDDVSVTLEETVKGIEVGKNLGGLSASYGIAQEMKAEDKEATMLQTIKARYNITNSISVEGQKEFLYQEDWEKHHSEPLSDQADDRLLLRFQKKF